MKNAGKHKHISLGVETPGHGGSQERRVPGKPVGKLIETETEGGPSLTVCCGPGLRRTVFMLHWGRPGVQAARVLGRLGSILSQAGKL